MPYDLSPLLIHSAAVPASAKAALRAARVAPASQRAPLLQSAARALTRDAGLDGPEACELVGLPPDSGR